VHPTLHTIISQQVTTKHKELTMRIVKALTEQDPKATLWATLGVVQGMVVTSLIK
jgi:hypothetical protein